MKKNLRIVSAAAAALLAVAPVAATSVSTVLADAAVTVNGPAQNNSTDSATLAFSVTNASSLVDGDSPAKATASISTPTLPSGATVVPGKADIYEVTTPATSSTPAVVSSTAATKLEAGKTYVARVKASITGLTSLAKKTIKVNGKVVNTSNVVADSGEYAVNDSGISAEITLQSAEFTIPDSKLTGAPYVREVGKTTALSSGSYDLKPADYSVKDLATALTGKYEAAVTTNSTNAGNTAGAATAKFADPEGDVRTSLKAAGINTKSDAKSSFDKPAAPFVVTLNVVATNGQKTTFAITVDPNASVADTTFPVITYNVKGTAKSFPDIANGDKTASKVIEDVDDLTVGTGTTAPAISFNYVPVNGVVDTAAIKKAFTATVNTTNTNTLDTTVDVSKVNTKVAGKYPVTVSATNAEKKTTKVTFYLTVGAKGATYKTVQSDGDIPVYKIEGNTVTDSKTTVKNGDQIAVFGDPIKVGDKSYTRINSADSNLYVESKYVDGSFKPAEKTKRTIMHNSYIYDKDHKRVGTNMLKAYSTVEVIGKSTKLADGSLVYQIGDNQYVMADNIDGTSRVLGHNAYVYKTSKKRANGKKLLKGSTVVTYGSPYKFKNGKLYYRIGGPAKQYVKVANFR